MAALAGAELLALLVWLVAVCISGHANDHEGGRHRPSEGLVGVSYLQLSCDAVQA
jgi:hypothetical protein